MRRLLLAVSVLLLLGSLGPEQAAAKKWPNLYFDVSGQVVDWDTKKAVQGATVLVFLNDSPYADNNGWAKNAPNAQTDRDGRYVARAILARGRVVPKKLKVEVVVLRAGYRTQRFVLRDVTYQRTKISTARYGLIKLGTQAILPLQKP